MNCDDAPKSRMSDKSMSSSMSGLSLGGTAVWPLTSARGDLRYEQARAELEPQRAGLEERLEAKRGEAPAQNAQEFADLGKQLYERTVNLAEQLAYGGSRLDKAFEVYGSLSRL